MLLKLYQAGQPILRKKAATVTKNQLASKRLQEIIEHMIETLRDAPGVGLAAPQIGENLRIIIIEDKSKYHEQIDAALLKEQNRVPVPLQILINPVIESFSADKNIYFEGCLSVEGYVAAVSRADVVTIKAMDREGNVVTYKAQNWHARILQHEIDHLNGVLYIDRMLSDSFMTIKNYNLLYRKALQSKIMKTFRSK